MRVLNFKFDDFTLIHIYAPTGSGAKTNLEAKMEFYDKLMNFVKKSANDNIIIAGDFNIARSEKDIVDPEKFSKPVTFLDEERAILDKFEELSFVDSFRAKNPDEVPYSSWKSQKDKESGHGPRLDYFFVSKSLKDSIIEFKILYEIEGSEYSPIELVMDIK